MRSLCVKNLTPRKSPPAEIFKRHQSPDQTTIPSPAQIFGDQSQDHTLPHDPEGLSAGLRNPSGQGRLSQSPSSASQALCRRGQASVAGDGAGRGPMAASGSFSSLHCFGT